MGVRNQNSTNYEHPDEPNLLNLHKAMRYNASGEPQVRVHVDGISLEGDVIVDRVKLWDGTNELTFDSAVNDGEASPTVVLPTESHNMVFNGSTWDRMRGNTTDGVLVKLSNGSIAVTGTFWQATQPVSGTVTIQDGGNTITVDGTVNANVTFPSIYKISKDTNDNSTSNRIFVDVGTPTISGTVELGTTSLSALENISATVSGTVELGATTLSALENTTVTISGTPTVNIGTIPEVEIKNDSGNPVPISGNVTATITGTPVVSFGGANLDAFGRLRVSNPFTLFDGAQRYRDDPFKWDQVDTGAASSTFVTNESSVLMTVLGNGDSSIRQTKSVFAYQPGKSLLTMATFSMTTPTAGLRQRVGLFGAQNGVYFEVDGTTVNMVIRKYTSGSVDDTTEKIPQSLWNGDKLLGTGPSGITLVVSRAQIFWCDIEWLGVGSVRCGFVIDGQFILCHTFHHANRVGFDRVYMTTATLPVRYELTSTGAAGTMRAICSTVMSEGGYMNRSITRSIGTSLTGKNLSDTVYRPLVCIRLNAANLESVVVPIKFDVFGLQLAAFVYRIILNPTLTGASWTSSGADSSVEYDLAATALSGGTVVDQGIFVGSNKGGTASITSNEVDFSQQIGRTIAGVSDIWCLAAIATTNNDDAVGVVTWQEHI